MPVGNRPVALSLWSILLLGLLAGCSTNEPFEQPAPVPEVVESVEFKQIWSMSVGDGHDGQYLHLEPALLGTMLYAVSADGVIVSVDPEDGAIQWQQEIDQRIMAGIGGDADQLYLVTRDAQLQAYSKEQGGARWDVQLPNEVLAAPQSNGSIVVVQTIDGKVLAFDVETGAKRWQYDGVIPVLTIRATGKPLVGKELTLVSFANGQLFGLSSETGQPLWQYIVGEPKGRTELERLVDVTSQPLLLDTAALVTGYQGKLAAVDIRSGQEIWSRSTSSFHAPAIAYGNLFVSESNGDIIAVDGSTRKVLWTQDKLSWRQSTQPLVTGDYVLTGDFEGYLYALSVEDGALQGQLQFDGEGLRVPMQRWSDGVIVYGNGGRLALLKPEASD
ncbi:outer membrane protein assembly factor BamB [Marinobacter caseinilyticus]|uniref:outer membrane protein assembly factor BamB n=1 Tax=Marinobacter caseinilyticus TaxID=2692195 RepID=UPI0014076220|nr:outer membrane protein assembly factor BamB [Marinobacter caseinilyticus]